MLPGSSGEIGQDQYIGYTDIEEVSSNWCMVVGFHPLVVCDENKEQMEAHKFYESLHHIFVRFGVNMYLSGQGCTNHIHHGKIAYIGNPGSRENESYVASVNGRPAFNGDLVNGFLASKVTYFISTAGEVVHRTVLQQRGKEVM
ncbi:hypothetical protein CJ030_MR0G018453 [Morella rubra]|uniref:Uncharacterized protein n=1 Tax=Morella rubra TaxID=262757 RepID=A0A6A1UHE4_9ROSI|nr:hypothetical protein CJ030_MR0G018453 [Morella rubra]